MPINRCQLNNKPGYKWGSNGKCYTYDPTSKSSETRAKNQARDQGVAIGEYFREMLDRLRELTNRRTKR